MSEEPWHAISQPGWHPCLKQKTRCVITLKNGEKFEATNLCRVGRADVCPRVEEGCPTGEGYDLCGPPKHAEAEAARLVAETYPGQKMDGDAFLYGHNWMCGPCQWALQAVGINRFIITGERA